MAPAMRRFNLSTSMKLDFPTVRSGRVLDTLRKVGAPENRIFLCALESGLIQAAPKLAVVHIDFLASDREELVSAPTREGKSVFAVVRFDAGNVLSGDASESAWRLYRAGLLALLAIAELNAPGHPACSHIRAVHSSSPTSDFPSFPDPTPEQWDLFHAFALFSKGRKSGLLTIELSRPPDAADGCEYDFQPVFDRITAALFGAKLGVWQGDSGNDIEFRSNDLAAAQSCVESLLRGSFHGGVRFGTLRD